MNISQDSVIAGGSKTPFWKTTPCGRAWVMIGLITATDVVGLHLSQRRVVFGGGSDMIPAFFAVALVCVWISLRARTVRNGKVKWIAPLLNLAFTARWMITLAAFCLATSVLAHLSVAAGFPLIDEQLVKADKAIGFDWAAWYQWVRRHPIFLFVMNVAYASGLVQMIAVPLILGMTGRRSEFIHHVTRFMVATVICLGIATLFPAASAFLHFHITDPGTSSSVSTFFPLRNGTLRAIDLADPQGLVSMPSMHTTMAILFAYALRRIPVLGHVAVVLNVLMIASTPAQGGHYLSDTVAGVVLALVAIVSVKRLRFFRLLDD
jgi:membrane-associated phospholipid phosphatase